MTSISAAQERRGGTPGATAARRGWLVSPAHDLAFFSGPAIVAGGVAMALPGGLELSPVAWLVLVVGIDVAHVYASIYRAYLDPIVWERWRSRLIGWPVAVLLVALAAQAAAPAWFWTAMAYLAVFHFVRQQAGFAMLYRAVEGLPTRDGEARLERWAHYALCGWPILWWHAHLPLSFAWFTDDDFVRGLPIGVAYAGGGVAMGLVATHLVARARSGRWSPGRDLWLVGTAAAWVGGIVVAGSDAGFTLANVVSHGVPYLALVHLVGSRRMPGGTPGATGWWRHGLWLAPLLAVALVEEGLWDALVWHDHAMLFGAWDPPDWAAWLAVPLLVVPQVTHYLLDGFVWRTRDNPELRDVLR